MKKVVCGTFGNIYYTTILKDGLMSNDRKEITNDCIDAVIEHIATVTNYDKEGCGGYDIKSKKDGNKVKLMLFDDDKYELRRKVKKESEEEE